MKKNINLAGSLLTRAESACMRKKLESRVAEIFERSQPGKYSLIDDRQFGMEAVLENIDSKISYPQVKLAYQIWSAMHTTDRHAVLIRFHRLYVGSHDANRHFEKTLMFCVLFINELAGNLAQDTE